VFLKNPLRSNHCRSTSFYYFPVILSRLESALQKLCEDVKSVDREQELIELHLSKVGLLFEFSKAYPPRPPKEIVAHRHYSSAKMKDDSSSCTVGTRKSGPLKFNGEMPNGSQDDMVDEPRTDDQKKDMNVPKTN